MLTIEKIICVGCSSMCTHCPSLHVYLEVDHSPIEQYANIDVLIESVIRKKHNDTCSEILFFAKGGLEPYIDKFGKPTRFELRDDINLKKLNNKIRHNWKGSEDVDECDAGLNCDVCYGVAISNPLNLQSFDTLTEWALHVPIIGQIILETFINKESATLSLNESEKRLKEKAISDFCYYNTYLKKYELTYESDCGIVQRPVNLWDCILIVLMDNLVRLKYHKDPEPGESRSMQICTLPITIKGLPKDARVVDNWHDANICDTTNECKCKDNNRLTKEEFEDGIICLNKKEKDVVQRFLQMLDWGFLSLWIEIFNKNISNTLPVLNQANSTRHNDEELNTSFASLNVSESNDEQQLNPERQT
ncbi:hypothetical protein KUTeg_019543 [Tegillarca granosa]|uniref:Uncharacterized protein n=1 Tax=Tegillarca granosa TaxID=220873 RepID=A0ABQ9EHV5_TEGGR|nr:hypothetical protein KUTeg_019543 [Tegillarca granosa]